MRRIFIFPLAILFAMISFSFIEVETFRIYFQKAFMQSIEGLDALQGERINGGWKSTLMMPNFDQTIIIRDDKQNILGFRFSMRGEDISVAEQKMARVQPLITAFLPAGDYLKSTISSNVYEGSVKTVYAYNSEMVAEKEKRPTVETGVVKTDDYFEAVFIIYEPVIKKQYSPEFK